MTPVSVPKSWALRPSYLARVMDLSLVASSAPCARKSATVGDAAIAAGEDVRVGVRRAARLMAEVKCAAAVVVGSLPNPSRASCRGMDRGVGTDMLPVSV